jgi:hypothetical protein
MFIGETSAFAILHPVRSNLHAPSSGRGNEIPIKTDVEVPLITSNCCEQGGAGIVNVAVVDVHDTDWESNK